MKKNIQKIGLFFASVAFLASCNELDTQPSETYTEETVWENKQSADAFVLNAYNNTISDFAGRYATLEAYSPNGINSMLSNLDVIPIERFDRYTSSGKNFASFFASARDCNKIIHNATNSTKLSATEKQQLIAEGHFLRGVLFFNQTLWQGRFVPILRLLSEDDKEAFKTPLTASPAESYRYIMDDFNRAIQDMPETSAPGRANKYAAHAFRSRAALQAYAYTNDASYLDIVIESANAIINSGKYQLDPNYGDIFLEAGQYSNEIILGKYYLKLNSRVSHFNEMQRAVPNVERNEILGVGGQPFEDRGGRTFECWGHYFPTQELVDQYLVIDQNDGKAKPWYETSQYLNNVDELPVSSLSVGSLNTVRHPVPEQGDMGSNSKGTKIIRYGKIKTGASLENITSIMYQNRDARFDQTIVRDQTKWLNEDISTNICGNLWAGVRQAQSDSWFTTASGYYWRKSVRFAEPRLYASTPTDFHYVLARLGEVYMNLAEAYLLKGDVANAVLNLNKTRVGHGQLPASTATSLSDAWADYIRERRVEMAYEGDMYWSFLRWGKYGGDANEGEAPGAVIKALDRPVHKIQITRDRKQFMIAQITRNGAWERNFTPKRYLMPIPQGELDRRSASGINDAQNSGW